MGHQEAHDNSSNTQQKRDYDQDLKHYGQDKIGCRLNNDFQILKCHRSALSVKQIDQYAGQDTCSYNKQAEFDYKFCLKIPVYEILPSSVLLFHLISPPLQGQGLSYPS